MKYLFSFVIAAMLTVSSHAAQKEFRLSIQDNVVIHNKSDWERAYQSNEYDIYIEKGMIGTKKEIVEFHAHVLFKEHQKFDDANDPTKGVYVFGSLHCGRGQLMILAELFVDVNNRIVSRLVYPKNENIIDMIIPNNPRLEVYNVVCKESI